MLILEAASVQLSPMEIKCKTIKMMPNKRKLLLAPKATKKKYIYSNECIHMQNLSSSTFSAQRYECTSWPIKKKKANSEIADWVADSDVTAELLKNYSAWLNLLFGCPLNYS